MSKPYKTCLKEEGVTHPKSNLISNKINKITRLAPKTVNGIRKARAINKN